MFCVTSKKNTATATQDMRDWADDYDTNPCMKLLEILVMIPVGAIVAIPFLCMCIGWVILAAKAWMSNMIGNSCVGGSEKSVLQPLLGCKFTGQADELHFKHFFFFCVYKKYYFCLQYQYTVLQTMIF